MYSGSIPMMAMPEERPFCSPKWHHNMKFFSLTNGEPGHLYQGDGWGENQLHNRSHARILSHSGVGANSFSPSIKYFLTISSLSSTPMPGFSGTVT